LNGTVTNTFDIAGPGVNDQIAVVGTFDVSGGGNVFKLNALNPTLAPGTYTLVTFASSSTLPVGDISSLVTLAGSFAGQIRNLTLFNTGTSIQLQVGAGSTLTWAGDGTANLWDLTNSPDWNAGADIFYQNDSVTFDNTSSNLTVNLTGTLLPTAIIVSSDSNYVFTSSGKISGTTGIAKSGSGTLTITNSGGNNYTGPVTITAGTLKAGVATALGATNGATTVTNTGALDIGGQNLGAEPVTVSGNGSGSGAILNSGVAALNALQFVTLAGDTTFSGPGRWDIRTNSLGAYLNGNGYNLTKVGTNDTYLVNVGNANLNNVTISQGRIGVQNNTALGASGTLTLAAGAGLDLYDTTVTNTKAISLTNATISSTSSAYGANVLGGAISLNGIGTFTATTPLQLNGALTNSGGVLKLGASVLTLAGSSTYTGNTTISNGVLALVGTASITSSANLDVASGAVLDVSGLAGGLATLGSAQTLKGNGTVRGSVTVAANATVSPGESGIGTLTVTNVLTLAGNTAMDVNWTNAVKSDQIVAPTINLGGTLILNNLGTTLAAGNYFPLFSGSVSGSFASIVPATPGYGLAWDTSYLTVNGRLYVVAGVTVNTNAFSITNVVSGSSLNLSWPSDHQGWEVLIQTNSLTTGLSGTWFPLTDTTNNTTVSIPIDVKNGSVFIKMIYPPQ